MENLTPELERFFGHRTFRAGQKQVVQTLLAGRSALAVFPTGGGKSLCYQLPAVLLEGLTLVISPLIALMKDQVDVLQSKGIQAARIDSTLPLSDLHKIYEGMAKGSLKLLYVAPERLSNEAFMGRLQNTRLAMIAVDEAHCISEWGHNFRPEYLRLAKVAKELKIPRVLALTATATPEVAEDICREFNIAKEDWVQTPFHRNNLHLHITPVTAEERLGLLTKKIQIPGRFPAIVYVTLQETASRVAIHLAQSGLRAAAYHAGLPDELRAKIQDDFMRGNLDVIAATIAFGMGIDKSDISSVFHFNLPKTLENYQQETGRAGRDGKDAHCEMLACADDLVVLQNFTLGDTPTGPALCQLVDHLLRQGSEFSISRYELSRTSDIRPLVLETVLAHLEHAGLLEPLGAFYSTYQIAFDRSQEAVLTGHQPKRKAFLRSLFACGKQGRKWLSLNIDEAAEQIQESRAKILKALNWLEEAGEITMKPTGVRHRFRLQEEAEARRPREVAEWIYKLFVQREEKDLDRLKSVTDMAEHPGCTTRFLLRYFGEDLDGDCGHCGNCQSPSAGSKKLPRSPEQAIGREELQTIQDLKSERHAALRSPRQITRFLCGITSPATIRDRLTRHDAFGSMGEVPFREVLAQVESMGL